MSLTAAEQARKNLIANGVPETNLKAIDDAFAEAQQAQLDALPFIKKRNDAYKAIATDPTKHTDKGVGNGNQCMLLAVGCDVPGTDTLRTMIYKVYTDLLSLAAGTGPEAEQANDLIEALKLEFEVAARDDKTRMLDHADMRILTLVLGRPITVIMSDGTHEVVTIPALSTELQSKLAITTYVPVKALPGAPGPIYVRYNKTSHYHRFRDAACTKLAALDHSYMTEQKNHEAAEAVTDKKIQDAVAHAVKANPALKDDIESYRGEKRKELQAELNAGAVKLGIKSPKSALTGTPKATSAAASKTAPSPSPSLGSSAHKLAPPAAPYIADQIQQLQRERQSRDKLRKELLEGGADVTFVETLEKLHRELMKAKQTLEDAKFPKVARFYAVLYGSGKEAAEELNSENVERGTIPEGSDPLFFALGVDASNQVREIKKFQNAQKKLEQVDLKILRPIVLASAIERFQARMQRLKAEQDSGKGDVFNPWYVQWAAIFRQEVIVVVKSDGTCVTYSPHIFTADDLKGMFREMDDKRAVQVGLNGMQQLGFTIAKKDPVTTVYVHEDDEGIYRQFTKAGQTACTKAEAAANEAIRHAQAGVTAAEQALEEHLRTCDPSIIKRAKAYSVMYAEVAAGKHLVLPAIAPAPAHAWETKLRKPAMTVTNEVDIARDIHRQNIDALLVLLVQGSTASRRGFVHKYFSYGSADKEVVVISPIHPPFKASPSFYAKGLTQPAVKTNKGTDKDEDRRAFILQLLKNELDAYKALKGKDTDSALVKDYEAIIFALEENIVPMNLCDTGLEELPASPMKPLMDEIHARVAGKAAYVADAIDHQAYMGRFGAQNDSIRQAIHTYRSNVLVAQGEAALPSFDATKAPAPLPPRRVTQATYAADTHTPRVVIRVKGMSTEGLLALFNAETQNSDLTTKDGMRVTAKYLEGRLKIVLVDKDKQEHPLTKQAWQEVESRVQDMLAKEVSAVGSTQGVVKHSKPRVR